MAFIDEIEKYKNLTIQVEEIKTKVQDIANKLGVEIEYGVDTPNTLLDKIIAYLSNGSEEIGE